MGKTIDRIIIGEDKLLAKGKRALSSRRYEEALEFARRALAINPKSRDAKVLKGRVYLKQEKAGYSMDIFKDLAKEYPSDLTICEYAGDAHALGAKYSSAESYYSIISKMIPQTQNDIYVLSILYKRGRNLINLAKSQSRSKPEGAGQYKNTGRACLKKGIAMQIAYADEAQRKYGEYLKQECQKLLDTLNKPAGSVRYGYGGRR